MHYEVLKGLLIMSTLLSNIGAIGIDGKLEFGNARSTASFKTRNIEHRTTFVPVKVTKVVETVNNDDLDDIGNAVQTDVVVKVSTRVDLNEKENEARTKIIDDTPDVPVVIGYAGSKLDSTADDENSNLGPQSIYVPNVDSISGEPLYPSSYGTIPQINTNYPSISTSVPPIMINSDSSTLNTNPSITHGYQPPVGAVFTPATNFRTEYNPTFGRFNPMVTNTVTSTGTYYSTKTIMRSDTGTKTNTIEVQVPYFDPSFHNHYYGENPPPQVVWHHKKGMSVNPVEFKPSKPVWRTSAWNRKVSPHRHVSSTVGSGVQCNCHNGQMTPNARWYPSFNSGSTINDPGSQINDKLAPLNK
ncbi:hypothetical protein NQ317_009775 [Molorchus minor]|uniref:Uncharacterized protein n=1 Tax=Molorchus minor TaxID=1323400 RepID=A0ABQ9K137_9CUCU|nr:hypothetical protein NQ317_009775 [Molorchus minor]